MCIAILNVKGLIPDTILEESWKNNKDGAGLCFVKENKLFFYKELDNFEKFIKVYKENRNNFPDSKFLIHFRIATSGRIDSNNCHPFFVNKNLGFIHNGKIGNLGDDNFSDTFFFNEILKKIPKKTNGFIDPSWVPLIKYTIGNSKIVFLNSENKHLILGEQQGHWIKEDLHQSWFSNSSYKKSTYTDWTAECFNCKISNKSVRYVSNKRSYFCSNCLPCPRCNKKDVNDFYYASNNWVCENCATSLFLENKLSYRPKNFTLSYISHKNIKGIISFNSAHQCNPKNNCSTKEGLKISYKSKVYNISELTFFTLKELEYRINKFLYDKFKDTINTLQVYTKPVRENNPDEGNNLTALPVNNF